MKSIENSRGYTTNDNIGHKQGDEHAKAGYVALKELHGAALVFGGEPVLLVWYGDIVLSASQRFHDIHPCRTESRQHAADEAHDECKGHCFCDDVCGHGEAEGKL